MNWFFFNFKIPNDISVPFCSVWFSWLKYCNQVTHKPVAVSFVDWLNENKCMNSIETETEIRKNVNGSEKWMRKRWRNGKNIHMICSVFGRDLFMLVFRNILQYCTNYMLNAWCVHSAQCAYGIWNMYWLSALLVWIFFKKAFKHKHTNTKQRLCMQILPTFFSINEFKVSFSSHSHWFVRCFFTSFIWFTSVRCQ